MKWCSLRDIRHKRRTLADRVQAMLAARKSSSSSSDSDSKQGRFLFNGGGTGSVRDTVQEPCLTEVTIGSGLLQSRLFDFYTGVFAECAFVFGLHITRRPQPHIVTCQSGGFISSGSFGPDKCPVPFLPTCLEAMPDEGFGEVQTPLVCSNDAVDRLLRIGDPVFVRPSKAGELAERFDVYHIVSRGSRIDTVKTYRGCGKAFY